MVLISNDFFICLSSACTSPMVLVHTLADIMYDGEKCVLLLYCYIVILLYCYIVILLYC